MIRNLLIISSAGLVLAIAGGLFAAFAASQIRPVFFDGKTLRDVTELPVIGTVSLIPNEARTQKERTSLRRFFIASAGLVIAYGLGTGILMFLSQRAS